MTSKQIVGSLATKYLQIVIITLNTLTNHPLILLTTNVRHVHLVDPAKEISIGVEFEPSMVGGVFLKQKIEPIHQFVLVLIVVLVHHHVPFHPVFIHMLVLVRKIQDNLLISQVMILPRSITTKHVLQMKTN